MSPNIMRLTSRINSAVSDYVHDIAQTDNIGGLYSTCIEAVERPLIATVVAVTEGNQALAAERLGINRNTLRTKLAQYGIDPNAYKPEGLI